MTALSTASFKQQLLQQRQDLVQQLAQLRGGASRVDAASAALGDGEDAHAQVFSERELELILDDRESAELDQIAEALQRIEAGTYGQCVDCGCDIPPARLHAAPEAARCLACQSRQEKSRQLGQRPSA